jgi:hypothetical protein
MKQYASVPEQEFVATRDERFDAGFIMRPPVQEPSLAYQILARWAARGGLADGSSRCTETGDPTIRAGERSIHSSTELVPIFHDNVLAACQEAGLVPKARMRLTMSNWSWGW